MSRPLPPLPTDPEQLKRAAEIMSSPRPLPPLPTDPIKLQIGNAINELGHIRKQRGIMAGSRNTWNSFKTDINYTAARESFLQNQIDIYQKQGPEALKTAMPELKEAFAKESAAEVKKLSTFEKFTEANVKKVVKETKAARSGEAAKKFKADYAKSEKDYINNWNANPEYAAKYEQESQAQKKAWKAEAKEIRESYKSSANSSDTSKLPKFSLFGKKSQAVKDAAANPKSEPSAANSATEKSAGIFSGLRKWWNNLGRSSETNSLKNKAAPTLKNTSSFNYENPGHQRNNEDNFSIASSASISSMEDSSLEEENNRRPTMRTGRDTPSPSPQVLGWKKAQTTINRSGPTV